MEASPALPTPTTSMELVGFQKLLPTAEIADHPSPTIREPAGAKVMLVTKYVLCGKKIILQLAYFARIELMLAVSSVTPWPSTGNPETDLMLIELVEGCC